MLSEWHTRRCPTELQNLSISCCFKRLLGLTLLRRPYYLLRFHPCSTYEYNYVENKWENISWFKISANSLISVCSINIFQSHHLNEFPSPDKFTHNFRVALLQFQNEYSNSLNIVIHTYFSINIKYIYKRIPQIHQCNCFLYLINQQIWVFTRSAFKIESPFVNFHNRFFIILRNCTYSTISNNYLLLIT